MARLDAIVAKFVDRHAAALDREGDAEGPRAAVAALLRERPGAGGAELFFIVRAQHPLDPWSGHVAFPGGRRDPEDASLVATAIRETREEVGIDLSLDHLVGRLPDLPAFTRSKRSGLIVTPFVFAVRDEVEVVPNIEVADTLWVPFAGLASGEGRSSFQWSYEGQEHDLPCVYLEPGKHRLWGMTFRMFETLVEVIR